MPWACTALTPAHTPGPRRRVQLEKANPDYPWVTCSTQEKPSGCSDCDFRTRGGCNRVEAAPWLRLGLSWDSQHSHPSPGTQQSPRGDSSSSATPPGMDVGYSHPRSSGERLTGKENWGHSEFPVKMCFLSVTGEGIAQAVVNRLLCQGQDPGKNS